MGTITRRIFLGLGIAAVGGLAVGYRYVTAAHANPLDGTLDRGTAALNPWLTISGAGDITVIVPRAEMGQGVHTTLAAMVAEELGVDLADVSVEHGPAGGAYFNGALLAEGGPAPVWDQSWAAEMTRGAGRVGARLLGLQATGGSTSVIDGFDKMRLAGAAARTALLDTAAERLGVPREEMSVKGKAAVHASTGRIIPFGDLVADAALRDPVEDPVLSAPEDWRLLGKSQARVDLRDKVTGAPIFGIDVDLPDMLHATIKISPVFGGAAVSANHAAARAVPGVVKIVDLDTRAGKGFGIIARDTWSAFRGAQALDPQWEAPRYPANGAAQWAVLEQAFEKNVPAGAFEMGVRGDAPLAFDAAPADEILEAEYRAPFLAHACMEPLNATAQVAGPVLRVWSGNQAPTLIQDVCAPLVGLSSAACEVTTLPMGGGFGRRFEVDVAIYATLLAAETDGRPVKVTWSREEDTTHDVYRPPSLGRLRAHVRANEAPLALEMRIASPSVVAGVMGRTWPSIPAGGADKSILDGLFNQPYSIPNADYQGIPVDLGVPVGFWRAVGNSSNGFFHESFMDEIAVRAGLDPLRMRLSMMQDEAFRPARLVLEHVAKMSNWGEVAPGRAKGLAFCLSYGTWVAQVVEVSDRNGAVKLERVWCAADPGRVLDPGIFAAQMESGIIFGLSAAMMQRIDFEGGRAVQTNFDGFDALRMAQTPQIEVALLENAPGMGGAGEPGTPPAAPALGNAIFALTGTRLREMPFSDRIDFA
jgi:isoquinoline 1-oxidoreductase beta subunit